MLKDKVAEIREDCRRWNCCATAHTPWVTRLRHDSPNPRRTSPAIAPDRRACRAIVSRGVP